MGDIKTIRKSDSGVYTLFSSPSSYWHRNTTQATFSYLRFSLVSANILQMLIQLLIIWPREKEIR